MMSEEPPPTVAATTEDTSKTQTTTTKTTTTTSSSSGTKSFSVATVSVNVSYLKPQGILKIIQIIVCIIIFSLIAQSRGYGALGWFYSQDRGYISGPTFSMAVGIIFFLTTLILLIMFLFNFITKVGSTKIWYMIDTVHNGLAVVLFLIGSIVLFVYCSYTYRLSWSSSNGQGSWKTSTMVISNFVVAGIFSIIVMILYILSIVFAVKAGEAPMIPIKA